MINNDSNVEKQLNRYWYTDGLGELIGGGMFIVLGVYFGIQEYLDPDSMLSGILQASVALLLIGGASISQRLINNLKTRLTYPRTGYVEYRQNDKGGRSRLALVMMLAFAVSALTVAFAQMFRSFHSIVGVTGFIVAMVLVLLRAKTSGLARFYVLGTISFLLGILLSTIELPDGYSLGLFYGLMGICFMVSGGLTLRHYLHEHPLLAAGQNG